MAISAQIVQAFLDRKLSDSDTAKRFTDEALDAKIRNLQPYPVMYTQPRRHQKISFLLSLQYPNYAIFLDPGLGKSKVMLDLYAYRVRCGLIRRCLVLVPNTVLIGNWYEQIETHQPELSMGVSDSGVDVFWDEDVQVVICTYAMFLRWCKKYDPKRTGKLGKLFGMLVLDESAADLAGLKNHTTGTYKYLRQFVK